MCAVSVSMGYLDPDPFLNELNKMYERNKSSGSVWITMKRSDLKPRKSKTRDEDVAEYKCLVRANDGKRHVSTTVSASQYLKFQQSVMVIFRAHMDALKRKEKTKPSKDASKK